MARTREQQREYMRQYRKNNATERNAPASTAAILSIVKAASTGDRPVDAVLGDLAAAVKAEIDSIPAATHTMPGLAALAIRLAALVETADNAGAAAQAAAQLRSTLLAVRAEAKVSAPAQGKLAAMQGRRGG